jgi:nucleoid DNA-binding protein
MNKAQLIEWVAQTTNTKKEAQDAVETLLEGIRKSLKKQENVTIAGFGTFKVKHRKARTARNPKTGATIQVPAKKTVGFKPSKDLNAML